MVRVKRKWAFERAKTAQIQIILRMRKVSYGSLLSIHTISVVSNDSVSEQGRPGSDSADAQAGLGLRCPNMPEDTFPHSSVHALLQSRKHTAAELCITFAWGFSVVTVFYLNIVWPYRNETQYEKMYVMTLWHLHSTKPQIIMRIRTDWSESSWAFCLQKRIYCFIRYDPTARNYHILRGIDTLNSFFRNSWMGDIFGDFLFTLLHI